MKVFSIILIILFIFSNIIYARWSDEEYEEWKMLAGSDNRENEQAEFDAWLSDQEGAYSDYRDSAREAYQEYLEKERQKFKQFVHSIKQKWGTFTDSTPTSWVDYNEDLTSFSVVDFEDGTIEVQAISETEDKDEARKILEDQLRKVMTEENPITEGPVLEDQVLVDDEPASAEETAKVIESTEIIETRVIGDDGKERTVFSIRLDLAPNAIQRRASQFVDTIMKYCRQYDVDPALVMALIHTESAFNPRAYSRRPDGSPMACGLMQIIPTQAGRDAHRALFGSDKIVEPEFLFDPETNIKMGIWYMDWLRGWWRRVEQRVYGRTSTFTANEYLMISSYNQGMGTIRNRAHKPHKLVEKPAPDVFHVLHTEKNIPLEGRDYIKKVYERRALYVVD